MVLKTAVVTVIDGMSLFNPLPAKRDQRKIFNLFY